MREAQKSGRRTHSIDLYDALDMEVFESISEVLAFNADNKDLIKQAVANRKKGTGKRW
jgi:hypothetical protein